MYSRLLLWSLRKNRMIFNRKFGNHPLVLKDANHAKQSSEVNDNDEPVKYSTSEAAKWKTKYSTSGKAYHEDPKIQSTVVVFSLAAFMVYFCILREENDLDDQFREMEANIPIKIEEMQLQAEIEQDKRLGADYSWKEKRLKELEAVKEKNRIQSKH